MREPTESSNRTACEVEIILISEEVSYDNDWLEFIVACRSGQDVWKSFDYVEGGVADDRVIDTVNMHIQGYISKEKALRNLRFLKPNNQICILNQELLNQHLVIKECLEIPTNGLL